MIDIEKFQLHPIVVAGTINGTKSNHSGQLRDSHTRSRRSSIFNLTSTILDLIRSGHVMTLYQIVVCRGQTE